ncbi:MAG: branched-chain amino acid ABC transporter permease [Candidatus Brocadiia bacterium]
MIQQIWNGLSIGAAYGLIAIGYTLIFGVIQVIFFAQGELSMLAAFAALGMVVLLSSTGIPLPIMILVAIAVGIAASCAAGLAAERVAIRPLRHAPRVKPLITSLGMSIVYQNLILILVGPQPVAFNTGWIPSRWEFAGVRMNSVEVIMIGSLLACTFALEAFLRRNRYGLAIRSIAQSGAGARLMGVSPERTTALTFGIASLTGGIAGLLLAFYYGVIRFDMGFVPGIKGFTIAILGGVGNVQGAVVAAVLVGVAEALFASYVSSDYRDVLVFGLLIVMLIVRPHGLLGEGE